MTITWKDWVKQAVASGGTGALTLGAAASGYQAFAAGDDGKLFSYSIVDGTAWETGLGTYTHSGTSFARTSRTASSTGSALTVSTSAFVMVDLNSTTASTAYVGGVGVQPGGRLTLESGVPVSTTDQTAKTTVYYTPYLSNVITLWDGNAWQSVEFSELSLAIGTVTADLGFDVFVYLSSGAAAIEKLAWTSATARATAITLQDGRYCKSGDKTRLWVGSFYSKTTTTTEDSENCRFVYNAYNQRLRKAKGSDSPTAFTYSTSTFRVFNARTYAGTPAAFANYFFGEAGAAVSMAGYLISDGGVGHHFGMGNESTQSDVYARKQATTSFSPQVVADVMAATLGRNSFIMWQYGGGDANNWRNSLINTSAML